MLKYTCLFLLISIGVRAQDLSGYVIDFDTKKPIPEVNVYLKRQRIGTATLATGHFTIPLQKHLNDTDSLQISHLNYYPITISYNAFKTQNEIVYLHQKTEALAPVTLKNKRHVFQSLPYKQLKSMPLGVSNFGSVNIDSKIYVVGGDASFLEDIGKKALVKMESKADASFADYLKELKFDTTWETYSKKIQVYDITTDSWTVITNNLKERAYHTVQYYKGNLYIMGGKRLSRNKKFEYLHTDIDIFNINDQTITTDYTNPHQAVNPLSFIYNNNILLLGGAVKKLKNGNKHYTDSAHMYTINTGLWYQLKALPNPDLLCGVLLEQNIYSFSNNADRSLTQTNTYNITSGTWSKIGNLPVCLKSPAITSQQDTLFILGDKTLLTYNTKTQLLNTYALNLELQAAKIHVYNNKLYIIGGFTENEFSRSPSSKVYCIDINEFKNTSIEASKTL